MSVQENGFFAKRDRRYIPKRYIVTLLGMLGLFNVYTMRVNLNVALVAMVNSTSWDAKNNVTYATECSANSAEKNHTEVVKKELKGSQYDWDAKTRGSIKSSFFYGYFVTVLTGGYFAERFGAKRMFCGGVLITALFTLLTPLAVEWGLAPFLAIRALEGVGEGLTFPAINTLISRWAPKPERSRISSSIFVGAPIGSVVAMSVSGWLCNTDVFGGWPSVFYTFGAVACVWTVFWIIFVQESPHVHPGISAEEMSLYSHTSSGNQMSQKRPQVLWKKVATSLPMWSVLISHIGMYFGFAVLLVELPTFLTSVHHLGIETSGLVSGLPNLFECVGGVAASFTADRLIGSRRMSLTTVRKTFNSIASYGAGLCLVGMALSGCNSASVGVLFALFMGISGFKYSGFNVTHVDMCPPIAGTLYGFTNGVASLSGIVAPLMVGYFTANGNTLANWSRVFYATAGVYFVSATFFIVFASAEQQPWIKTSTEDDESDRKTQL